jgi:2-oxo-4-hydroxy-4-carboxy-5-ureidoimidazoline decarboxylase
MNQALARWNLLDTESAMNEILPCCGSKAWATGMAARRPVSDEAALLAAADDVWRGLAEADWLEAFHSHPRIGESPKAASQSGRVLTAESVTAQATTGRAAAWSKQEQRQLGTANESIKSALAQGNRDYEGRFNRIFIICATGKSPEDMLTILRRRLQNDEATELLEAAEQQRQITQIRLRKWLHQ